MIDSGMMDHKIITVATGDPELNEYEEASQLPAHYLRMQRRFFQDYKQLGNEMVEVEEIGPAKTAFPVIEAALARYSYEYPTTSSA